MCAAFESAWYEDSKSGVTWPFLINIVQINILGVRGTLSTLTSPILTKKCHVTLYSEFWRQVESNADLNFFKYWQIFKIAFIARFLVRIMNLSFYRGFSSHIKVNFGENSIILLHPCSAFAELLQIYPPTHQTTWKTEAWRYAFGRRKTKRLSLFGT